MKEKTTNKKPIIILISIITFLALLFISIQKIHMMGKILTKIQFLPDQVQIQIDDKITTNNSELLLEKGEHKVYVSLDGYNTISETINISENNFNIYGYLIPNSLLNGNPDELEKYIEVQERTFYSLSDSIEQKILEAFPIYRFLPYNDVSDPFSIYTKLSDDNMSLTVILKQAHPDVLSEIDMACQKIKDLYTENNLKVSPSQNNITILNFDNKLKNFRDNQEDDPNNYISAGYSDISDTIHIFPGKKEGDYYYTMIRYNNPSNEYDNMLYRILLKKNNNSWQLVDTPYPILTTYNTKNTPYTILNSVNNYSYSSGK